VHDRAIQNLQPPGQQRAHTARRRRRVLHLSSKQTHALATVVAKSQALLCGNGRQQEPQQHSCYGKDSVGLEQPEPSPGDAEHCLPLSRAASDALSTDGYAGAMGFSASQQEQEAPRRASATERLVSPHGGSNHLHPWQTGNSLGTAVAATLLQSCCSSSVAGHVPGVWEAASVSEPSTEAGDSEGEEQEQGQHVTLLQVFGKGLESGSPAALEHMRCVRRTRSAGALAWLASST
jgi:hypothetical protein